MAKLLWNEQRLLLGNRCFCSLNKWLKAAVKAAGIADGCTWT
jgi:hypothetical protein